MWTPRPESAGARRTCAGLCLIFLLGLGLRAQGIGHGMPRNYLPDTHIVRSALGMAQEKTLVPPVGQFSSYPNLLPYCLLPIFGAHFVVGKLQGEWDSVADYKEHLLAHPEGVHKLARWLVALFGALTPLVVFQLARVLGMRNGAWVASWFAATGLMNVHFSVQERPWVPMVFFAVLSAWPAALYVREPKNRTLMLAGVCAALAAACHQSGLFVLALPGLAWLVSPLGWNGVQLTERLKEGVLCVFVFGLVALLLGYPAYLLHGMPTARQTIGGDQADLSILGQPINFGRRFETFPHLARAFFGYGPVLCLFALAGLPPFMKRRMALPAGLFALGWAAFFMTHSNDHVRYILPLTSFACLPAGLLAERAWSGGRVKLIALGLCASLPLVQSWRLGALLARDDSRVLGEAWLADLPADARVLVDRYGPIVERDRASLELLLRLREASGEELYGREAGRLQALRTGKREGGRAVLYASDLFETSAEGASIVLRAGLEEICGKTPQEALVRLGITHILLVNRYRPGLEENLLSRLLGDSPGSGSPALPSGPEVDLRLPLELEFPITSLWKVQRPGPWLGLYPLP